MGPSIITFAGYVLLLLLDLANSSSNRRCFPLYDGRTLCFIRPDPLVHVALSWSDAQQWCRNIGATLPIPHTYNHYAVYGNALGYFGLHNRTMWVGANSTFNLNEWYWTNGTRFTGKIDHGNNTLKTHAYIVRNGTDIKFVAADPRIAEAGFICQPSYYQNNERRCAYELNSFWSNGTCYTKNRNQHYEWNSFVSNCGGLQNLPTLSLDDLNQMSQWIDDQTKFWIGLRCTWWTWQDAVSGKSFELTEFRFGGNFPNNTSPECLASYDNYRYGSMHWMNQKCSTELQFICQQYADPTTTTRTTMSTSTTTRRPSSAATTTRITATTMNSTPSKTFSATPRPPSTITPDAKDSDEDIDDRYGLVVSLGFGLCAVLSLAGIIWLAALTARVYKINRNSPKALQKQRSELLQLSYSNPYEIPPFDNTRNL